MAHNPAITLSGEQVDQIAQFLSTPIVFVRSQDGSLRPFVDPAPIMAILSAGTPYVQTQLDQPQEA